MIDDPNRPPDAAAEWLEGDPDEGILALFGPDPWLAIADLTEAASADAELEEQLVDVLETSLEIGADSTVGTAALAVVLGELRARAAIGPLLSALDSADEMVVAAAVRALRRIGEPAIESLVSLLDAEDLDEDVAHAVTEILEGLLIHDHPEAQSQVEARLMRELLEPGLRPRRREAAALALARLGVARAKGAIEPLLESEFASGNTYLQEALEIIEEHPEGLPSPAELAWQMDLQWADSTVLPGGDLDEPEDPGEESNGPDLSLPADPSRN